MPMIPQTAFAALACARIGAIHSVVFGGFAAEELASRIDHSEAKLIITCSMGIEPSRKVDYIEIIKEAMTISKNTCEGTLKSPKDIPKLYWNRYEHGEDLLARGVDHDPSFYEMNQLLDAEQEVAPAEELDSTHPLYILYTSGTTGDPKGVVRDHGGTSVALSHKCQVAYNFKRGRKFFGGADLGWVVGHSIILYGSLIQGCENIIFEGKPVIPDAGVIWKLCQDYKIESLFLAPTAIRELMKFDNDGALLKKYDTSQLRSILMAGERCDPNTIHWLNRMLPHVVINDNWWQTETGWAVGSNILDEETFKGVFPTLPGSVTKVLPGWDVRILDDQS
mmetsp:Transcript_8437/g.14137  ORF Transcript_8437/g.14137 Transcript_8437/m.14137 type:complete len:336 (-) Transcript_8437:676-1683(-)